MALPSADNGPSPPEASGERSDRLANLGTAGKTGSAAWEISTRSRFPRPTHPKERWQNGLCRGRPELYARRFRPLSR
ncbi:hypothetical protein FTUN_5571 [Frigoriglobus tundricola]|uniref:Uncharacterized protein n=1 Tax=Frigoriglobus tundricola TaxID=2774151 RepID=A0A6M5YXI2_9BACT|nr:hypothetical protein FTUN_5571 [Frigoriglobus tundricola]